MTELFSRDRMPGLILWAVAALVAGAAIFVLASNLFGAPTFTPARAAVVETPTPSRTLTATATGISRQPSPIPQPLTPIPTPGADARPVAIAADSSNSGFYILDQEKPNRGDRNLHVGFVKGRGFESFLYFDLTSLPPGTKIVYAAVELVGLSRDFVGNGGSWQLDLLNAAILTDWANHTAKELAQAESAATIGSPLAPQNLIADQVNRFAFSPEQTGLLETAINSTGQVAFRLHGPTGPSDNLFTWDNGTASNSARIPVLRLVVVPSKFIIVPNVPTPANVMTAAAFRQTATAFASAYGTPTPYPRNYATATPLIVVTSQPTPANQATATALSAYATAVAATTGTFTPTPSNWITATPLPPPTATSYPFQTNTPTAVALANLTAIPTPTPQYSLSQLLQTPVPAVWKGNILFLSNRYRSLPVLAMSPDGALLQTQPTGLDPYILANAREPLSSDHTQRVLVAPDSDGILQIWIADLNNVIISQVTHLSRAGSYEPKAYDPVWSPDGSKIAYVSTESRTTEIYVYDVSTRVARAITGTNDPSVFNQRPSWSPDSARIAFKSNRGGGHFQIWIMNADGSYPQNVSQSDYDEKDPVWVK